MLTPEREKVRQNGRRFKDENEAMFTLTAQDRHGVMIKNGATGKPWVEAFNGDSINLQPKARGVVKRGYTSAILTSPDAVLENWRIRKLTPRECWRLQGFSDDAFDKVRPFLSDAQLYKQAGNSVTVNVIQAIGQALQMVEKGE